MSLFKEPVLSFTEKYMTIAEEDNSSSCKYHFSDPSVIVTVEKDKFGRSGKKGRKTIPARSPYGTMNKHVFDFLDVDTTTNCKRRTSMYVRYCVK